ncbi:Endoribonuclease L-PSP [Trichodelitschia bisporula]|uniref:Endoribonuclease L-PSP n=1 Tax=Trichodelitschia bisporula TaxID=703511 RepID=A0A6G1HR04_9PEZI|nr:Endoribonuclease L-PSP [Trichodelitschia bisporula]
MPNTPFQIVHNNLIYCSGNIGLDPSTNALVTSSIGARTIQAIKNLSAILEAGGSSLEKIIKVNIYLTTMANFAAMNEAYKSVMPTPFPARTCVAVKELPMGTDVEIECVAYVNPITAKL